jgi:8-oxo-dGTP pyrophosphatase MutT (NUDIX family)
VRGVAGSQAWREGIPLVGGFVDPNDSSLEAAARREVMKEAHIEIATVEYVGSYRVDDWRFLREVDKIMTTVFVADYKSGHIQPDDRRASQVPDGSGFRIQRGRVRPLTAASGHCGLGNAAQARERARECTP